MVEHFKTDYERFFQVFKAQTCISGVGHSSSDQPPSDTATSVCSSSPSNADHRLEIYNISFAEYIRCCQQNHFTHIFLVHSNVADAREFYDELVEFLANDQIQPERPFEMRIFAFYTLYTVWYIMNKAYNLMEKIRVDNRRLKWLQQLTADALERKQFDVALAYRRLFRQGAFAFCHSATIIYGPHYRIYNLRRAQTTSAIAECSIKESDAPDDTVPDMEQYFRLMEQELGDVCTESCDLLKNLLGNLKDNC